MDNTKELTHISLCTGYGGIDLGLKRAIGAVRTVCFVEIEAFVIQNLVAKIEAGLLDLAPVFTNLKTFPWESFRGRVDILSGGFPCQPFSAAGNREGDQDPRHLFPFIVDGIKRLGKPSLIFLENVEGIISSKLKGDHWSDPEGTPVLLHVLRELERLGYKATAGVFSASEVGAPHQRKRVFIFGIRDDLGQSGIDYVNGLVNEGMVGNTEGKQDWIGEQGEVGDTVQEIWSKIINSIGTSSRDRRVAYPAGRGKEQYWYEPPRVTLGNTDGRDERPHGREHRILSSETEDRKTSRSEWSSATTKLGNTNNKGLERCRVEERGQTNERRYSEDESCPTAGTRPRGLQGETEPKVGRNADGSTDWLDYAELYHSCDSRTDELRMLGNGVVPETATRAFITMWKELVNT